MIARPRPFSVVFLAMIAVILSFPIQAAFLYGHSLGELTAILNKISMLNWLTIGVIALSSVLILRASPWVKVMIPFTILAVFWNNFVVGHFHTDFSLYTTMLATVGFGALFAPLLYPSARKVLADPKRRWWLRSKRYHSQVSATLNPFVGQTIHAKTFDISEGGAFISLKNVDFESAPKVGEKLRLTLKLSAMRTIRVDAVIVRSAEPVGRYPKGLGLQFIDLDKKSQKNIKKFLSGEQEMPL